MRLSKKSLTAMIAISIAMTVLPAAAILSNLPNRFDSDRPTNHISSKGDGTNAAKQDQYLEENQDSSTLKPSSNTSTSNDATVSSTSIFQTEDIDDNSIAIIGFNLDEENQAIEIPATINEKNVVMLKNENKNACMPGADKIKSLSLSDCGSISIDDWAFYQCTNLTSIDLSDCASVSIGTSTFAGCQKLTSANLTNSTSVGDFAFYQCSELADSINLSGCTSIGNSSFEDCANIRSVALPSKSYTIGNQAFFNCTSLSGTPNLSHCSSIGYYAFANCTKLTGALNLSRCSSIKKYAFSNCTGIHSVAFPTTPYIIEECAFANCTGITRPIDLSGCISIGENAFVNCSGITGFINLSNCTSVGKSAFAETLVITQATMPAPAAPQKESQTIDSITLKEIDTTVTEQGDPYHVQYGIVDENDQINWQDTPTFTNLIPGVDYTFYIRYALTGTVNPDNYTSSISVSKSADFRIEQPSPPAEGTGFTIDYVSETIFIEDGYEAATDPDFPEQARLNSGNHITPDTIIYVRTAATADAPASDSTANKIAPRPVAPTDRPVIKQNGKTIEVQNPVDTQEYLLTKTPSTDHSAEFDVWQDSPVFTDDTMSAGDTYTVSTRIKATETSFSSDPVSSGPLTIGEHAHQVKLDGGNTGENWTPSDGTTYDDGYDIPTKLYIEGHPVYQVQLDWGDMALVYDMRSSSKGWGDSFDGENNIITVTNQSSEAIDATLSLDITETNLGFSPQLVAQNAIENDVTNPSVSDTVKQLASGNSGNTQSAYINLEHENDQPSVEYNSQTNIGAITVTIQKSDSD